MIQNENYSSDDWTLIENELDVDVLAHSESLFALSNGHVGMRGNLEEGEPHGLPGSYLNSYYESRPLPYAEPAYSDPEAGQTMVNVTNAKIIRLLVDDEPFDVRYGELQNHRRVLDFRTGLLTREAEWTSPAGQGVRIRSQRLVSLTHRAVAAIRYEVEPLETDPRIVIQSELVANEPMPKSMKKDPRASMGAHDVLVPEGDSCHGLRATLLHRTERSRLLSAAAMDHEIDGPEGIKTDAESNENLGRVTIATDLEPGESLCVVKFIAYGWSAERSLPALRDQVEAALASARRSGWEGLVSAQREYLDDYWERGDVRIDGDPELQQAVRFAMFHNMQAGARVECRGIPSKGLTGTGYDGHTFWDSESFVLPVLTYTNPNAARDALLWRHSTLDLARERAHQLGLEGAAFPWRTIHGEECSGYWPAGTAAFHINADIADAVVRYQHATLDERFGRECGLELLVETARLWRSLGHHDPAGQFRIDGVTGPDEYSAIADNNVYTNLMAERNLRSAADAVERHPDGAKEFGVDSEEAASWRDAAAAMFVPYDETLGVHEQSEDFTEHATWDFEATDADQYPLLLNFPYYELYRKQVVKQADLVMALFARGDWFTAEQKQRDFAYYEALTVRDSSLSACVQAIVAAEVGHIDLAFDYFAEAALVDINDSHRNTSDGLHLASLAGAWVAAVCGFGGFRDHDGELSFTPRIPSALKSLSFRFTFSGRLIEVRVRHEEATYKLLEGEPIGLTHHGEELTLESEPLSAKIPPPPDLERPTQPAGREPVRREPPRTA